MTDYPTKRTDLVRHLPGGDSLVELIEKHQTWRTVFDERNKTGNRKDLDEQYIMAEGALLSFGVLVHDYETRHHSPVDPSMLEATFTAFSYGNLKDSLEYLAKINYLLSKPSDAADPVLYREVACAAGRALGYMRTLSMDLHHPGVKKGGGR
jgi:hypothetical protein